MQSHRNMLHGLYVGLELLFARCVCERCVADMPLYLSIDGKMSTYRRILKRRHYSLFSDLSFVLV
jgi:hypothetical protein